MIALHAALSGTLVFFCSDYFVSGAATPCPLESAIVAPLIVAVTVAVAMFIALRHYGYPALRLVTLVSAVLAVGITLAPGRSRSRSETFGAPRRRKRCRSFDPHHLPAAVLLLSRENEFGFQFYRDQPAPAL